VVASHRLYREPKTSLPAFFPHIAPRFPGGAVRGSIPSGLVLGCGSTTGVLGFQVLSGAKAGYMLQLTRYVWLSRSRSEEILPPEGRKMANSPDALLKADNVSGCLTVYSATVAIDSRDGSETGMTHREKCNDVGSAEAHLKTWPRKSQSLLLAIITASKGVDRRIR